MISQIIYGSCVARDTQAFAPLPGSDVTTYIARQSFISIGRPSDDPGLRALRFESPFQERLFRGDLEGDALERILLSTRSRSPEEQAIVIDLIDERGGIHLHPSGSAITRSIDGHDRGAYESLGGEWTLHAFGSLKHWTMYAEAAERVKEELSHAGLFERTRVLGAAWAEYDENGDPVPGSFGFTPAKANDVLEGYYELLRSAGWHLLDPGIEAIADSQHKWGPAPFHYAPDYYEALSAALADSFGLERQGPDSPT